jgi:hypothetical protein
VKFTGHHEGDDGLDVGACHGEGKNALLWREICDATSAEMAEASMPHLLRIEGTGVAPAIKDEGGTQGMVLWSGVNNMGGKCE